jgi:hypothetical protein
MKSIRDKYLRFCPQSGRFVGFKTPAGFSKLLMPVIGFAALLWIVFRVATKPSRVSYPCVRAAMPLASTFLGYLLFLGMSTAAWLRSRKVQTASAARVVSVFALAGMLGTFYYETESTSPKEIQLPTIIQPANQPMGTAMGIFPGRVVWVHDPDATNENCIVDAPDSAWFVSKNMNQTVVDGMLSAALQNLTGQTSDAAAWRAIFQFHNATRGKGAVEYVKGEKIFVKTNATSSWGGNYRTSDLSVVRNQNYGISETSVASVLAVLRQLVYVVGVNQSDIYVGDPLKHIYKHLYDVWHAEFPDVHYLDNSYSTLGREKVVASSTAKIHYSDHGAILRSNVWDPMRPGEGLVYNDYLYSIFQDAEYMINIPMLKGHKRAGMTMFAKNHFGSHTRADASHLHNGLVAPMEMANGVTRAGYGLYRVQVDLMSHSLLGKKNLVYIMDALWATVQELGKPLKWRMTPFNNDWMSSIFVSLDPVGIETVGYDFLRTEFTAERGAGTWPQMDGVDDYLHQAADSLNWPSGIKYDPDSNGVHIASLGVHEHWNDGVNRQYSRDLRTGNGIELLKVGRVTSVAEKPRAVPQQFVLYQNYPNPFNPTTIVSYELPTAGHVALRVYNTLGQEVVTLVNGIQDAGFKSVAFDASHLPSGVYYYRLTAGSSSLQKKMALVK